MTTRLSAGIFGVGMAVPNRLVTNADLEKIVETDDEWIFSRTGIRERRVASETETVATLGIQAAQQALADAKIAPEELDMIVCATTSGDHIWPAAACLIQQAIGAKRAAAFDVSAACSGYVFAMATAASFIESGAARTVLVVGADTLTKQLNWHDRNTCILFGDGASAAVLAPCASGEGILASALGTDGSGFEQVWIPAGGTKTPATPPVVEAHLHQIHMRGAEVYKFAVKIMGEISLDALCRANLSPQDVALFVPHQANIRIINAAAERMGLPPEKVFTNVHKYGNTSAASVGIALAEAVAERRIHRGDVLVLVGFGAGLTWGANVIRWNRPDGDTTHA